MSKQTYLLLTLALAFSMLLVGLPGAALAQSNSAVKQDIVDIAAGSPDLSTLVSLVSDAELVEMGIGLALFHGLSKLLIGLGCEPDQMDTTEVRTPGS